MLKLHICAESEEQAEEIAWSVPYIHKPSDSIMVDILSPREGSTISLNQPTLIKAEVFGDSEGEKLCRVIATFNNSDEEIALVDNGLHNDGQADDGVYANTWIPKVLSSTKITISAYNCIANTLDNVTLITPKPLETKIVGNVTNTTDYPLENVDMYLYDAKDCWEVLNFLISWFFDPTTPVPPYISHTKTNSTGNYNFTALTPGSYLVLAVPQFDTGYLPKASDVRAVAKNEKEIINLKLERKRYLAALDDEMTDIRDLSRENVNKDTEAAADVYVSGHDTFVNKGIDVDTLSLVLGGINFAMSITKPSIPTIHYVAGLIGDQIGVPAAKHGLNWAIATHWKDVWNTDFQGKLATYASQVNKLSWLKNFDYVSSPDDALENGYYTTDIYKNTSSAIDDSFNEYDKLAYNETAPDFSLSETENVLENQVGWLKGNDIADGIIITPKGNVYLFKTAQAHRHDFYNAKAEMEAAGVGKTISDVVGTAGHCIRFAGHPEIGVPVQVVAWGAGMAFSTFEIYAQNKMAKQWSYTQVYWAQDLDTMQKINKDIVEWLKNETDDPRLPYVNGEIIDTDIHPFITIGDRQFVWANKPDYPWWWVLLPKARWWAVNDNTVKIKSTSSIDDVKTRILCIDRYGNEIISEEPTIYPNATEPPVLMDKNEIKTIDLLYIGDFQIFNPFHWHYLSTILWMEGKQPDIETDVYYVIPLPFSPLPYAAPNKSTMSAQKEINMLMKQPIRSEICAYTTAKSHSPITLEEWISLVGNCTKIIDTNLDPVNDSTQVQYTTNASITNVTFLMATIPGTHIDLHVYDEVGRHVGYDPITDSDEIQIPSGTYTGSDSNPEIVTIPLAASKTFTISANATQFTSSSPTPVEIYAIETPVRPAVLGISPVELYPFISPGESKNITMQLAEVGKQVDIEDVTITPHEFTDVYGNSMSNVTISISPNNFNIDKGAETFINLNLNASESIIFPSVPETRYTGNITINTSNAGEINATLSVLILDTDLPNAKLTFAEPNVTGVHALGLDLSAVDKTYKPAGVIPQSAYMINSTGAGNFTLKFTDIPNANTITAYKINATNHWIPLDTSTTTTNVTFTMDVGDYAVVFGSTVFAELYTGWNMISLPLKPADLSASSVLATIPNAGGIAYLWNASKGSYDAIYGDMELAPGRAYWISVTGDGIWTPTGSEIHGTKVNLTLGWNMIGVPSAANVSVTDIAVTVGADTYTLVEAVQNGYIGGIFYSWNTANEEWDATIISDTAVLKPGTGYFANVNQECVITYP